MSKKTAVVVIHGVGPHMVFETCDAFVQGFCTTFERRNSKNGPKKLTLSHKLKERHDSSGSGKPWIQSYVSYHIPDKSEEETVDFYEYFWDIYMVHKPNFRDAFGC